ncbi:MAG: hypothetical protein ACRDHP_06870 [Ktedonobacterales bacterium]
MCGQEQTTRSGSLGGRGNPDGALVPVTAGAVAGTAPTTVAPQSGATTQTQAPTPGAGAAGSPAAGTPAAMASAGSLTVVAPALAAAPNGATAPIGVTLAAAPVSEAGPGPDGAPSGVLVAPSAMEVAPSPAGPVGEATLTLTNLDTEGQVVWISDDTPDLVELAIGPAAAPLHVATVMVRVDLAQAAGLGAKTPGGANLYVTTATGTQTVRVNWKALPYGSM